MGKLTRKATGICSRLDQEAFPADLTAKMLWHYGCKQNNHAMLTMQVMHIAAVTEVHTRLLPSMETLHVSPPCATTACSTACWEYCVSFAPDVLCCVLSKTLAHAETPRPHELKAWHSTEPQSLLRCLCDTMPKPFLSTSCHTQLWAAPHLQH